MSCFADAATARRKSNEAVPLLATIGLLRNEKKEILDKDSGRKSLAEFLNRAGF